MRYVRLILVVLTGLALLSLGIVAGLYAYATPERLSSRIGEALKRDAGLILTPSADVSVKRLPKLEIRYPRTAVSAESARLTGNVDAIIITMNPFAVFAQRPKIDSIQIVRPDIELSLASLSALARQKCELSVTVEKVAMTDGEIRLTEGPVFSRTSAGLSGLTENGAGFALNSQLSLNGFSGNLSLSAQADWHNGLENIRLSDLRAESKGLYQSRSIDAVLTGKTLEKSDALLTATGFNLSVRESDGLTLTAEAPALRITPEGARADTFSFGAAFPVGDRRESLHGTAGADIGFGDRTIVISRIAAESATLLADGKKEPSGRLSGNVIWTPAEQTGDIQLDGQYLGTPVVVALRAIHPEDEATPVVSGKVQLGDVSDLTGSSLARILQRLSVVNADISLSAALLENTVGLTGLSGRLTALNGHIVLSEATLSTQTGDLPFHAELKEDGSWAAAGEWKNLQPASSLPPVFTGSTSGIFRLSGQLDRPGQSRLQLTLEATDGRLYGADLEAAARIMADEQPETLPGEAFSERSLTAFSHLALTLSSENGVWSVSNGAVQGNGWQAAFTGSDGRIAADVQFRPTSGRGHFDMPAVIAVDARKLPVWTPDWQKALASAVAADGELPMTAGRMKDKILRELRNWWDNFDITDMKLPDIDMPDFKAPDWLPKFGGEKEERPAFADRPL